MIGTFQGHEGAWIRGVCVPARFPFHGENHRREKEKSAYARPLEALCQRNRRHVPYNTQHSRLLRRFSYRVDFSSRAGRVSFFIVDRSKPTNDRTFDREGRGNLGSRVLIGHPPFPRFFEPSMVQTELANSSISPQGTPNVEKRKTKNEKVEVEEEEGEEKEERGREGEKGEGEATERRGIRRRKKGSKR